MADDDANKAGSGGGGDLVPARHAFVVDGRRFAAPEPLLSGMAMAERAGLDPEVVLVRTDGREARLVDPAALIALDGVVAELRSGSAGRAWPLTVDGAAWDWPAPGVLATEILAVAGAPDGHAVFLAGAGAPVRDGGLVDLTVDFPPRLVLRPFREVPEPRSVPVIVNGRPRELAEREVTFEDLVAIAFPQLPVANRRAFTVTYRRGAPERPEGSLVARQAARLAPGAVVNVSATDKS